MKIKALMVLAAAYLSIYLAIFCYVKYFELEKPLFLTHYYEKIAAESSSIVEFNLFYFVNQSEEKHLVGVSTKGESESIFRLKSDVAEYHEGVYVGRNALIEGTLVEDELVLNEMVFLFSDGSHQEADIGEIRLIKEILNKKKMIDFFGTGSSNQGESFYGGKITSDATLVGIHYPFEKKLDSLITMKLNSTNDYNPAYPETVNLEITNKMEYLKVEELPLELERKELLRLNGVINKDKMYTNGIHALEFQVYGYFKTKDGTFQDIIMHIGERLYLTQQEIKKIDRKREENQ
ncbi:hypothetical protein JOC86_002886 [Bacillus pakistanensis]|uniref:Uncharacterized protein n=1 Tax=Rossellomorea pakistanensis TaxID=992288 RepID=A0ABS2NEQ9_9BACI|nr:hypothetical protein [Bacillus pakistanensis]MBM7586334.1 hypothetical protein [Bacillus pakistanensis]